MRAETERFVQSRSGDVRLWTTVCGTPSNGVPILFFNGGPGCNDYLAPVARLIEDVDQVGQIVRFEARGCGRSDRDGRYDLDSLLLDAEAVCQSYGFERWIVLGHSAGVNFALAYALRHPVRTIGVIGLAGGRIVNDREWSATYQARLEAEGEDTGDLVSPANSEVNQQGNAAWRAYCKQPSLLRMLADLLVPCVFINASNDIRPNWPTQQLANLIPYADYVEIAGAAHYLWLTHANELQQELRKSLNFIFERIS